jgi:anti-sigma B factor antagonist
MGDEFADSFHVDERTDGDRTVLVLRGELDLASVDGVRDRLLALHRQRRAAVLDLDELTFMDSTGIRLVLEAVRAAEQDGWPFFVTRGSPPVRRIFGSAQIIERLPYTSAER